MLGVAQCFDCIETCFSMHQMTYPKNHNLHHIRTVAHMFFLMKKPQ